MSGIHRERYTHLKIGTYGRNGLVFLKCYRWHRLRWWCHSRLAGRGWRGDNPTWLIAAAAVARHGGAEAATSYQLTGGTKVQAAVIERLQPRRTTDRQIVGVGNVLVLFLGLGEGGIWGIRYMKNSLCLPVQLFTIHILLLYFFFIFLYLPFCWCFIYNYYIFTHRWWYYIWWLLQAMHIWWVNEQLAYGKCCCDLKESLMLRLNFVAIVSCQFQFIESTN